MANDETRAPTRAPDHGFTHVALPVAHVERSVGFYARLAGMEVVHRRIDPTTGTDVVWLSDRTRPFVIVLVEQPEPDARLGGIAHLGVGCASRAEVDGLVERARGEGRTVLGPVDSGSPVGYWAMIEDPDGHNLEVSFGQEIGLAVECRPTAPHQPGPGGPVSPGGRR